MSISEQELEELEREKSYHLVASEAKRLVAEIRRLRETLSWYADEYNYDDYTGYDTLAQRAREALGKTNE